MVGAPSAHLTFKGGTGVWQCGCLCSAPAYGGFCSAALWLGLRCGDDACAGADVGMVGAPPSNLTWRSWRSYVWHFVRWWWLCCFVSPFQVYVVAVSQVVGIAVGSFCHLDCGLDLLCSCCAVVASFGCCCALILVVAPSK